MLKCNIDIKEFNQTLFSEFCEYCDDTTFEDISIIRYIKWLENELTKANKKLCCKKLYQEIK
jgi:hypothetical protein